MTEIHNSPLMLVHRSDITDNQQTMPILNMVADWFMPRSKKFGRTYPAIELRFVIWPQQDPVDHGHPKLFVCLLMSRKCQMLFQSSLTGSKWPKVYQRIRHKEAIMNLWPGSERENKPLLLSMHPIDNLESEFSHVSGWPAHTVSVNVVIKNRW